MANVKDYLDWRGDLSFEADPLNEVDCLILAWLSYARFDGYVPYDFNKSPITLREAATNYYADHTEKMYGLDFSDDSEMILKLCAESKRFGEIGIHGFRNEIDLDNETQFAAYTVKITPKVSVVVYRGTDSTLVGWKEDFNMSFLDKIPSQTKSLKYLEEAAAEIKGDIITVGHSKGGNLAIYAPSQAKSNVRKRVISIYNFDGPGFQSIEKMGKYFEETMKKTVTFVPGGSIVGMLLNHDKDYFIAQSNAKGIMQHQLESWQLLGTKIVKLDKLDEGSSVIDKSVRSWLEKIPTDDRKLFCDALFKVLGANGAKTTDDLRTDYFKTGIAMIKEYSSLDKESREMLHRIAEQFIKENLKEYKSLKIANFKEIFPLTPSEQKGTISLSDGAHSND